MKEASTETIHVYGLRYSPGDKITLLLDSSVQNVPLEEVICFFLGKLGGNLFFGGLLKI